MSIELRLVLLVCSVFTLLFFLAQIRKSRMQIPYAISWALFSLLLLLMGVFPDAVSWVSRKLGFQSPSNLVFVVIIFILIIKLFTTTVKLSAMNRQIADLAQSIALQKREEEELAAEVGAPSSPPPSAERAGDDAPPQDGI